MDAPTLDTPDASRRVIASPYARRLARERGMTLAALAGSGPRGRIVAADLEGAVPVAEAPLAPALAALEAPISAMPAAVTGSVSLDALVDLIGRISASGRLVTVEDAVLRATALALQSADFGTQQDESTIRIEPHGASLSFMQVLERPVGALQTLRRAQPAKRFGPTGGLLSLRIGSPSVFAPAMLPLVDGFSMRLLFTPERGSASAGVLLCFDAARVEEDKALRMLEAMADLVSHPLALFV